MEHVSSRETKPKERVRVTIDLPASLIVTIEKLRIRMGHRSRGALIEHLLHKILADTPEEESFVDAQ